MTGLITIIVVVSIAGGIWGWTGAASAFLWLCVLGIVMAIFGWLSKANNSDQHVKHDVNVHIEHDGISDPTYPDEHPIISAKTMEKKFKSLGRKGK